MQNSAENDERVMTLVRAALRLPAAERAEFLRVACVDSAEIRSEVAGIVEWEDRMGDFLREPLIDLVELEEPGTPQPFFQPGESVSDRFVILREVGQGGMGIVYEAFDRKRNRRIAIKCAKAGFGRLLAPELEGALRVRHPNICLVNDTHTATTEAGSIDFLTMEFIEGETLSVRLARQDRLAAEEAMEVARQLCAGLAAAHHSGILHRDLKPTNIILSKQEDGRVRAVITDFGLAAELQVASDLDGGTPRYMAPELWNGEKPSKASDVYALGVILHEMVTGQPPRSVQERGNNAVTQLNSLNNEQDKRWNEVILPCLDPDPAMRPQADEVLAVFERQSWLRSPMAAVTVLALLVGAAALWQPIANVFKPADIRLAVLPIQALPDLREMGSGIVQDVVERIQRSQRNGATLVVIPPSEAARNNVNDPRDARIVLHATHALQIELRRNGDRVTADESLIDLATEAHLRDFQGQYAATTWGNIPTALTGAVTSSLRLRQTEAESISPAATLSYDRGLSLLHEDRYTKVEAVAYFEEAARLDPRSPLPLAGLAEAHIGNFKLTKQPAELEMARKAVQAAQALNPDSVTVRLASGALNEVTGQSEKALEDYRRVQELEPRNVEAYIRTGRTYEAVNMPDNALQNYQKAIALQPEYYEAYEWLGTYYYYAGKYTEAAEQFQKAIDRAPGRSNAYFNLGAVLDDLNRDDEAVAALQKSLQLKKTARALNSLGAILAYQGKDKEAADFYEQAVELEPGNYKYRLNVADSYRRLGRRSQSLAQYREGMKYVLGELRQNPRLGPTRAFLGYFKSRLDDQSGAEEEITEALTLAPGDSNVMRFAILVHEALGQRKLALDAANAAPKELLIELKRHPDLADLSRDSRYLQLLSAKNGG